MALSEADGHFLIVTVVDELVRSLPAAQVQSLAERLMACPDVATARERGLMTTVPTARFFSSAQRLFDIWQTAAPALAGPAVGLALHAAARTAASLQADQSVDLVWTGPTTRRVPVRLTRAALLEVIAAARHELYLLSFAAYRVPVVLDALQQAAERGVALHLVLESSADSAGKLSIDAAAAFSTLRGQATFYVWPAEQRPVLAEGSAVLHAKGAVADDQVALVTSANLTGHGIQSNMELGVLVRGGVVPGRLRDHLAELIGQAVLAPVRGEM